MALNTSRVRVADWPVHHENAIFNTKLRVLRGQRAQYRLFISLLEGGGGSNSLFRSRGPFSSRSNDSKGPCSKLTRAHQKCVPLNSPYSGSDPPTRNGLLVG
jgi:hypothetical protein